MKLLYDLRHEKTNDVVSKDVLHKLSCTSAEDGYRLEILNNCTICVVKTKVRISFSVTAKLICNCEADLHLCFDTCKMLVFS